MMRKPRVLLIPNVAWWIIGEMGKQIIARFGDKYDFYFVPEGIFERRPELLRSFLPAVDAVHCLNESSIDLFRDLDPQTLPPVITWIHHVTTWSPQHQLAAERSAAITVCTQGWKNFLSARIRPDLPTIVVPHGVDSRTFHKSHVRPGAFDIPSGRFVVGFIGSRGSDTDAGRKGTDVFLQVVRAAAAQLPNLHVVLGGPGWEAQRVELTRQGISCSATGYIRKADLPSLYSALDVYLLTSRIEGGPCTVFEAMASQTAVVATRVGAVPDLILDGVNGFSAEVDDVSALAEAIIALGRSPALRSEIGRKARESVQKLPWSTTLNPLESVYDAVIEATREARTVEDGPGWMKNPNELFRTSSAADALSNVIVRMQNRSVNPFRGMQLLSEMLERKSLSDIVKGLAMLRGLTYKSVVPAALPSDRIQVRVPSSRH